DRQGRAVADAQAGALNVEEAAGRQQDAVLEEDTGQGGRMLCRCFQANQALVACRRLVESALQITAVQDQVAAADADEVRGPGPASRNRACKCLPRSTLVTSRRSPT